MDQKAILLVKYQGKEFYARAIPFITRNLYCHKDVNTDQRIGSEEVRYRIDAIKKCNINGRLGYVKNISRGTYTLRSLVDTIIDENKDKTYVYASDSIKILKVIYRFQKND